MKMSDVIIKARELGEAVAASDAFKLLEAVKAELNADEEAQKLLNEYNGECRSFARMMESDCSKSEINAASQRVKDLDARINENNVLSRLKTAQSSYNALMNDINDVIAEYTDKPSAACSSGCAGCQGCG